ncbi:MAG: RNA methyltransferase [Oscillospiraceae bacterium]|jgi:TrmH family RNA methyltransferase|nr:RNA methyltransferase [Oscillospiraceae bacterium]
MDKLLGRGNRIIAHIRKLGVSKEYRDECREFMCDGDKLLGEAVRCGARVLAVLTYPGARPPSAPDGVPVYTAARDVLKSVSPLQNPQDVVFTCAMPERPPVSRGNGARVILEGVQDPGNVGSVIRTAAAFGISEVILTGRCADVYNPKTVRATMGAVFSQSVTVMSFDELSALVSGGLRIVGASPSDDSADLRRTDLSSAAVAIGSEGRGLSADLLSLCAERVKIPMLPGTQSLNASVAAAIIMWELARDSMRT